MRHVKNKTTCCSAEGIAGAAFEALAKLLQPVHGCVEDHAACILRQLMPGLLGLTESSTDSKENNFQRSATNIRSSIIAFALQCCRWAVAPLCLSSLTASCAWTIRKLFTD